MRLRSARVIGFQSFTDSGLVNFTDGINLIVGQNNAGKSALLRALLVPLADDRHRTPDRWEDFRLQAPVAYFELEFSGRELEDALLRTGSYDIPIPYNSDPEIKIKGIIENEIIRLSVSSHANGEMFTKYPGLGQFDFESGARQACAHIVSRNGVVEVSRQFTSNDTSDKIAKYLWIGNLFYFSAERMSIGESGFGYQPKLMSNAGNLPMVLNTLAGDRGDVFNRLVTHLRAIFPTVGNVSVRPKPNNNSIEVRVWPTEAQERVELSFPLKSSGTGVSQVIALLTAIMTIENAVIIIDEINSFLHPAAVKALLRILQTEYSQHQYIISTHAPEVIGFSNPSTIHLVKRSGYESSVERLELAEVDQFREVAEHLGVSMADVFAADRIVWVEGPTEELCFPFLYHLATSQPLPRGMVFTSVVATGDFISKRRDRELVYQVYRQLSSATVPLVKSVQFSFDSEELSETEKADMVRESGGTVHFLPRRHLECYLIDPEAITSFIVARDVDASEALSVEAVRAYLTAQVQEAPFHITEWAGSLEDEFWLAKVDAAKLIAKACSDLSDARVRFNKKGDTLALLKLVRDAAPEKIKSLADYVRDLANAGTG